MFARAIVIDPGYARAYAGVADCCSFLYQRCEASEDNLREAVSASPRAVELDPQFAETHASLGFAGSLSKNYQGAGKEFETALRWDPRLFEAYYFYGRSCVGRNHSCSSLQKTLVRWPRTGFGCPGHVGRVLATPPEGNP